LAAEHAARALFTLYRYDAGDAAWVMTTFRFPCHALSRCFYARIGTNGMWIEAGFTI
jgi:hypothetical protein